MRTCRRARRRKSMQLAELRARKKAERAERQGQAAIVASNAAAAKKKKEDNYFACLQAREEKRAPCACGAADSAHCILKSQKFCTVCRTLTASGCTKKKCASALGAPAVAVPAAAVPSSGP